MSLSNDNPIEPPVPDDFDPAATINARAFAFPAVGTAGTTEPTCCGGKAPVPIERRERRTSLIGAVVNHFQIDAEIGSGGMGTVYRATQLQPIKRTVALKMIRQGLADSATRERFLAERQALALMDHSDIARVYEADTTEQGTPYFAMEFCSGQPIDQYCDQHRLNIEQRIELVERLARAVEHAHRQGVVHRDLKPDNVLVYDRDGKPELKIIDFGIAKLSDQTWDSSDQHATRTGELVGTPAYMSPEQAGGGSIDGRTDVFALGAILFKLLTGTTPLLPPEGGADTLASMIVHIQSYRSLSPSTRISSCTPDQLQHHLEGLGLPSPRRLLQSIRGDLDWICLKAIEENRLNRYATAEDFANDLRRWLSHEPVSVAAPSWFYRFKKYYQRRPGWVWSTVVISTALLLTLSVISYGQWDRYLREQEQTNQQLTELQLAMDDVEANLALAEGSPNGNDEAIGRANGSLTQASEIIRTLRQSDAEQAILRPLEQRLKLTQDHFKFYQSASRLADRLTTARERATVINSKSDQDAFGKLAGLQQVADAMREFGIVVGLSPIQEAAAKLKRTPLHIRRTLIETLDFAINELPTGAGIYLHERNGQLTIAELVEHGPAQQSGQFRQGDRILKINEVELVGSETGTQLLQLAYRELFSAPGSKLRITIARAGAPPFTFRVTCAGESSHWILDLLSQVDPDPWRDQLRQALLFADLQQLQGLAESENLDSQTPFSLIQLASGLVLLERSNRAIDLLSQCQREFPGNFWANHYLGIALTTAHDPPQPEQAIGFLRAAVAIRPESLGARLNLAEAFYHAGDPIKQLEQLREASELAPDEPLLIEQIRRLEYFLQSSVGPAGDSPKTADVSLVESPTNRGSNEDSPDFSHPHFDETQIEYWEALARHHAAAQRRSEVAETLQRLEQRFPDDPLRFRARGVTLLDLGDFTAARIVLADAARQNPGDAATRFYHGFALQYEGNSSDAIHEYQAALKLRPDYQAARDALAALGQQ